MEKMYTIQAQITKDMKIGDINSVQFWLLIEWSDAGAKVIGQFYDYQSAFNAALLCDPGSGR